MKNTQVKTSKLITKRFVIRKSLIGKNTVITFTNKNNEECTLFILGKQIQSRVCKDSLQYGTKTPNYTS